MRMWRWRLDRAGTRPSGWLRDGGEGAERGDGEEAAGEGEGAPAGGWRRKRGGRKRRREQSESGVWEEGKMNMCTYNRRGKCFRQERCWYLHVDYPQREKCAKEGWRPGSPRDEPAPNKAAPPRRPL